MQKGVKNYLHEFDDRISDIDRVSRRSASGMSSNTKFNRNTRVGQSYRGDMFDIRADDIRMEQELAHQAANLNSILNDVDVSLPQDAYNARNSITRSQS